MTLRRVLRVVPGTRRIAPRRVARLAPSALVLALAGCASFDIDDRLATTNEDIPAFTGGALELARTDERRAARAELARELLAEPLGRDEAVRLALANSPALQAVLASAWADGAAAAQAGRIPNPVFAFERLATDGDAEVEIERMLAFGLLDLLTLPWRAGAAEREIERAGLELTSAVVDHVTEVRTAWVEAVAARQGLIYAEQVRESAATSAEMARRMESVGNFSRLARARQQVFYADATVQLATARHEALAARERLVRLLGLDGAQLARLELPDRLPDVPETPMRPDAIAAALGDRRLDVRMAEAALDAAAKGAGLGKVTSFTDVEIAYRNSTVFSGGRGDAPADALDDGDGRERESADGYELEIVLPLFDFGGMRRAGIDARTLAAMNDYAQTLAAMGSNLRESYSAYRTSHDIAAHYRDEVLPLRETISEENVYRYNGMLIGVFELLADSRESIGAVLGAIDASRRFWLAEASLQASLTGRPTDAVSVGVDAGPAAGGEAH